VRRVRAAAAWLFVQVRGLVLRQGVPKGGLVRLQEGLHVARGRQSTLPRRGAVSRKVAAAASARGFRGRVVAAAARWSEDARPRHCR